MAIRIDPRNPERAMAARAQWLADVLPQVHPSGEPFHSRGLFYKLVMARVNWPRFKSKYATEPELVPFENTGNNYTYMINALSVARWSGLIAWEMVIDEKAEAPEVIEPEENGWHPLVCDVVSPPVVQITSQALSATTYFSGFNAHKQPYRLMIWSEKASVRSVLTDVANRFDAEVWLQGSGDISNTHLHNMAQRIADDGRTAVIFTFSDCDPGGWNMPASMAYKLACMRDVAGVDFDFRLVHAGLRPEQVRGLGLPSAPLKDGEKRAEAWRKRFGIEQIELDALVTKPDLLEDIAVKAIEPYYDATLNQRTREARDDFLATIPTDLEPDPDADERARDIVQKIEDLREELLEMREEHHHEVNVEQPKPQLGEIPPADFDLKRDGLDGISEIGEEWTNHKAA